MIRFDVDAWARSRLGIHNDGGGRGYDRGIRVVSCPFHPDETKSAWVNVETGWVACFNPACDAHAGMNAVEAARRLDGFRTWTEALVALRREFPVVSPALPQPLPLPAYEDWCELSAETRWMGGAVRGSTRSIMEAEALRFCEKQWGVDGARAGLGYCIQGRYAWRVIIPVMMGGRFVAFQARSYRDGEPKYLTSKWGKRGEPRAECGRPAEALLFNLDAVEEGSDVVVVEGAGDAMRWETQAEGTISKAVTRSDSVHSAGRRGEGGSGRRLGDLGAETGYSAKPRQKFADYGSSPVGGPVSGMPPASCGDGKRRAVLPIPGATQPIAVALLGTALTDEKAAILAAKGPGRVIVALDAGAEREAVAVAGKLAAWGLETALGAWVGGKDAGAGARLELVGGGGLRDRVAGRMGR